MQAILDGFDEAHQQIKTVRSTNSHVKSLVDQLEKDLKSWRNKSRKQQIKSSMSITTSREGNDSENITNEVPTKFLVGGTPVLDNSSSHVGIPP